MPPKQLDRGADRFVYTYDYGDNWRHDVIIEEVRVACAFPDPAAR